MFFVEGCTRTSKSGIKMHAVAGGKELDKAQEESTGAGAKRGLFCFGACCTMAGYRKSKDFRSFNLAAKRTSKTAAFPVNKGDMSKQEMFDLVVEQINDVMKDSILGDPMLMRLSDDAYKVETIPTGSPSLDAALGGGLAKGRIIETFGAPSAGKTTLALTAAANVQKSGGVVVFIDVENALDPDYAKVLGVDTDAMAVAQPSTAEDALGLLERLVQTNVVDLIVVDSVPALLPRAELEGEIGDSHVATRARLMSQSAARLVRSIKSSGTTVLFINQERDMIGQGGYGGPKKITPGGKALKFYASQRIEIRRKGSLKSKDEVIGSEIEFRVVKNKIAPPFKTATSIITFGEGINAEGELFKAAITLGTLIHTGGGRYTYADGETKLPVRGENKIVELMKTDPEVLARIQSEFDQRCRREDTSGVKEMSPEEIEAEETES